MSVTSLLYKYPLDLTGKSPTNLVRLEPHTIGSVSQRAFVTNAGPFYTKDVIVREAISGRILIPYEQYLILQPYQEASVKTGLEVASIIYITDTTVDTEILVDYQVVGGEFSWTVYALKAMLESLDIDSRPVHWGDIIGTPTEFRPSPHLHDLGDSYGWEYIAYQLEGIRNAILLGDAASHDELRQQLALMIEQLRIVTNGITASLEAHKANHSNPHQTTAAMVGLGNVVNSRHATDVEATFSANINNVAPDTTYVIDTKNLNAALRTFNTVSITPHLTNLSNPHSVTKTQVGLSLINNWDIATKIEAENGTTNVKYMTPLRTKEAIDIIAAVPLNAHISNLANPHQVTKAQVGLGAVLNVGHATTLQSQAAGRPGISAGGAQDVMGVGNVEIAIDTYHSETILPHINNLSNPHNVTAAQVGLGNISNYLFATQSEAENGTSSTKYMSPLNVSQAITVKAINPLNAHINNLSNPHNVTKTQVGLGSVENYGIATTAEAQAGVSNVKYMTPLRTKEAITSLGGALVATHSVRTDNPHGVTAAQTGTLTSAQIQALVERYSMGNSWGVTGTAGNHQTILPSWVRRYKIIAVGGGGGGAQGLNHARGGAGGAGAYYEFHGDTAATGFVLNFTVGAGGVGGQTPGNASVAGGGGGATVLFGGYVIVGGGTGGPRSDYEAINPGGLGGNCSVYGDYYSLSLIGAGGDGSDGGSNVASWGGSGDGGASFYGGGARGVSGPLPLMDTAGYPAGSGGGGGAAGGQKGQDGIVVIYY